MSKTIFSFFAIFLYGQKEFHIQCQMYDFFILFINTIIHKCKEYEYIWLFDCTYSVILFTCYYWYKIYRIFSIIKFTWYHWYWLLPIFNFSFYSSITIFSKLMLFFFGSKKCHMLHPLLANYLTFIFISLEEVLLTIIFYSQICKWYNHIFSKNDDQSTSYDEW